MKKILSIIILTAVMGACNNSSQKRSADKIAIACSDECKAKGKTENLTCKLTTPELQKRKETVLASLKNYKGKKRA